MGILLSIEVLLSKIGSLLPLIRLIPSADKIGRKEGISAIVCIRNEPWIEPCLLSIKDIVDEIIVVDSSTVDIDASIKRLRKKGLKIKYVHIKEGNPAKQQAIAFKLSTRKWILRWDGDFIAYTSRKNDIKKLKTLIASLNVQKYHAIWFSLVNMDIDLFHTAKKLHREPYLFTYSNILIGHKFRFIHFIINLFRRIQRKIPLRSKFFPLPNWYNKIVLDDVFVMHLRTIKSRDRLLERPFQHVWLLKSDDFRAKYSNSYNKFLDYVKGSDQGKEFIKRKKKESIHFDKGNYDYPIILKSWIKENLQIEIKQTKSFNNKLCEFLNKK